jgi:hypothetical protein
MKSANGYKLAHGLAQFRAERERSIAGVITEFTSDPKRLAREVLYLRGAVESVYELANWMKAKAPYSVVGPGPAWQSQKSSERNS